MIELNHLIGIGLKPQHYNVVLTESNLPIGWFEVHSENFFQDGGTNIDSLIAISKQYKISLHGIGLSLGSAQGIQDSHLLRIQNLISKIDPYIISEHLSWSIINGVYLADLLPIPYTEESFQIFKENLTYSQKFLRRNILIENPSSYIEYKQSEYMESEFLARLHQETGCHILLDINNIFVSCSNHGWNPEEYIKSIPNNSVKEIHLAGHSIRTIGSNKIMRIDTHDNRVCDDVWELYKFAISKFGRIPTLIEWDSNIPTLDVLIQEAEKAKKYIQTSF